MEKRTQGRDLLDQYYSVDLSIQKTGNVYQFKLRDMSSQGLGILVREDSAVLPYLKKGLTLDMKYNPPKEAGPGQTFQTKIRHITPNTPGTPDGHVVVGIEITDRQPPEK